MRRREFIKLLGGAATTWPLTARAQQPIRRIGVLNNTTEGDAEGRVELAEFVQALKDLGRIDGENIKIDYRFGAGDAQRMKTYAKELVGLKPDVILARSTPTVKALMAETNTIPIVFISVSDPVGDGIAASFARPGGTATGFTNVEASMAGKWVELLKEIVPVIKRVNYMFNPQTAPSGGAYYARLIEAAASALGVVAVSSPVATPADIEASLRALAHEPNCGLIALPDAFMNTHRALVVALVTGERIPAVFTFGHIAAEGGLIAYGVNTVDLYRRAAGYVDRVLKGESVAELPVQAPTKFELVINLNAAKAMGLKIPETFLLRADKVIE